MLNTPPQSLCILRLSAIGDVTHVLPTLRTLQKSWPETRITWVIGKLEASLVEDIDGVEFIIFDKRRGAAAFLSGRRFDVLFHMQVSLRASLASLLIKAPLRVGFDRSRAHNGQWLFSNRQIRHQPNQHVLDSFLEFPRLLGLTDIELRWDIPLPAAATAFVTALLPAGTKYLTINPCSSNRSRNWRNWEVRSYAAIIDHAHEAYGLRTVLTGGPSAMEREYARRIIEMAAHPPLSTVGKTNLKELAALLQGAEALISPDTGPAHLANAMGTPVIGLYASSNPARTGPYHSRSITIDKYPAAISKEFGKSVNEVRWGQRVRDPEVMRLISDEEVLQRLDEVLRGCC